MAQLRLALDPIMRLLTIGYGNRDLLKLGDVIYPIYKVNSFIFVIHPI